MTAPAYACPANTIGPSVRSRLRLSAATSSARDVSGSGAADTFTPSALSAVITCAQLDPSAHAPWASTTLTSFAAILLLLTSWPAWPPSAQRPHPSGDGPPDLVRRIFLEEMDPRDRHLGLRWQPAGEVEIRAAGDEQTGLGLHEQLGYTARRQPARVGGRDRSHVGGLAFDGDLPGPRQRRPPPLAVLGERPSILRHLLSRERAQDGIRQNLLDEVVVLQDH